MAEQAQQRPTRAARSTNVSGYKIGAALTQLGSYLTTYAFFAAVLVGAPVLMVVLISAGVEFVLFLGKKLLFDSRGDNDAVGWAAMLFDTLLNAGGLWPYVARINATPPAVMLVEALHLDGSVSGAPGLILALLFGYLLAIAPHRLWNAGKES